MEQRQASTKPTGVCEKIYKAVAENRAFRSIHRLPLRSQSPRSENATLSPNHPGGRTTDSPSKTHFFLRKQVSPQKPRPGEVNIPIQPGPSIMMNEKEKVANPSVSQQSNGRLIMINSPKIQPADHSTTKGDKTGTPSQSQPTKPATVTMISESGKVKASVASGNVHLPNVSSKKEAKPPAVSVEEKPKQKAGTAIPPSNMTVVQSPGQGIIAIANQRVEPAAKPHMPVQGLQPKPHSQPAASVVKVMAKQGEPTHDTQGKEDNKPENGGAHDHNHKYSNYIEYVKDQLRSKSNIGQETTTARPPTRTPTRRDSFNDRVSNFIKRARKTIKTTHLGD